jgi:hypothetical protein
MADFMDRFTGSTVRVAVTMGTVLVFGASVVVAGLWRHDTVASGLMWAGAWSAVGWFLGFLFGIPRFLSTDTARKPPGPDISKVQQATAQIDGLRKVARDASGGAQTMALQAGSKTGEAPQPTPEPEGLRAVANAAVQQADEATQKLNAHLIDLGTQKLLQPSASLTVNTNLEQISDWLTKIIVGVSLVESKALLDNLRGAALYMSRSMGPATDTSQVVAAAAASPAASAASAAAHSLASVTSTESLAMAAILYFLASGLLGSYLLTRLYLQPVLNDVANGFGHSGGAPSQ